VLTELAREVAARCPEGQDAGPRVKVVQRLLLHRVEHEAARTSVGGEHDLFFFAHAHEAHAALAVGELAEARADVALDPSVFERVIVATRESLHGVAIVASVPLRYASRHVA